jgi:hypothetical protein
MTIDLYTIRPADVESANQEVLRLGEMWRRFGYAKVDTSILEEEGRVLTEIASRVNHQEINLLSLRSQVFSQRSEIKHLTERRRFWEIWQSRYSLPILRLIGLAITAMLGGCAGIVVRPALGALVCLIGVCVTVLVFILVRYSDITPEERIDGINRRLENAESKLLRLETELQRSTVSTDQAILLWKNHQSRYERLCEMEDLASQYEKATRRYQALMEVVKSHRYQLLHSNWRDMRSTTFESFLQEVFEMLGYTVETTKASGDQGIDLILIGKGRRIGVQAKGYADNVGNHAVMEAHAGRGFYHCDSCVVVTNSDFTRAARDLAKEIGCLLIAGVDIPALIN